MNRKKTVTAFYHQLSLLLEAGFTLLRALTVLAGRVSDRRLQVILRQMIGEIERGSSFWEALRKHPKYFPSVEVQLIRTGESSGNLDTILESLYNRGTDQIMLMNRLRSALAYPAIIVIIALVVIGFLTSFVVPTFKRMFEEINAPLPPITRAVIFATELVRDHWFLLGLILVLGGLVFRILIRLPGVRYLKDRVQLRSAILGPFTKEEVAVSTCGVLGLLLKSGINLVTALELTRDATPNGVVADGLQQIIAEVNAGRGLEAPLRRSAILPPVVVDMLVTGQETGTLDTNLLRAADIYRDELENKIRMFSSLIEPIMVLFIGSIVMFVVLSFFLPYIRLITTMSGAE